MAYRLAEKHTIKNMLDLQRELERLIDYLYSAEERDYREHKDVDHIFQSVLAVERWLHGG